jgi:hypothetical protein
MHIDPGTHEHGSSGQVYNFEGEYELREDEITWNANIIQSGKLQCTVAGTVPLTSPALAALAEKVVRDAIIKRIDNFVDNQGAVGV